PRCYLVFLDFRSIDAHTQAWLTWKIDHSILNMDERANNIILKPAIARFHIGRVDKIVKRSESSALRLSYTQFGHGADPSGQPVFAANAIHLQGTIKTTDPLNLEVCDSEAAQPDGLLQLFRCFEAFIQTNWRLDKLLKFCRFFEKRTRIGLLKHKKTKLIEGPEYVNVLGRICSIRVNKKR